MTKLYLILYWFVVTGLIVNTGSTSVFAQARLVLNGAVINIEQGAYLVIENPAADAITRNSGYILSEGEDNMIKWMIGTTTGTYTIPWGHADAYFPLTFSKTAGIGNGNFLFSTYHTGWQNSADLPNGVANMNGASGTDNSAFASDRFWQINAQDYTTKPALSSLQFTYIDAENTAVGNTINESNLRANRYNTSLSSWTDNILESTLNTTENTVTVASVDETNLHAWWVVGMLGANLYWVAPSNSTSNLSANWSLTSGGPGNAGVPSMVDALIFDANSTTSSTIDADLTAANLVVDAGYTGTITQGASKITLTNTATFSGGTFTGGTADILVEGAFTLSGTDFTSTSATLELKEHLIVNSGSFAHNNGTVKFSGTATQHIDGPVENMFNHISVTNAIANPGVSIESNQNLAGVLTLSGNSILDADGSADIATFTLLSSADAPVMDAAIGILPTGANVTGKVTVQRYMTLEGPNGGRIYRYIASPVQDATVADLQQELPVTGSFSGSSTCAGCSSNPSMFVYDESIITDNTGDLVADLDDGYLGFPSTSNTETFTPGTGYAVFIRTQVVTSSGTWDLTGPITQGNSAPVQLSVSYNSSGELNNDGWNLVGNPFPSAIDWNAENGWSKNNLISSFYIRDNGSIPHAYATWNGEVGTNGGSRYIAMGQAFWVKADGNDAPSLFAAEEIKAPGQATSFFRETSLSSLMRIFLVRDTLRDEAVIHFREGAEASLDNRDAWKLSNGFFNVSTLSSTGEKLAINTWSKLNCNTSIRLVIEQAVEGSYALNFSSLDSFEEKMEITLEDKYRGTSIGINGDPYNFEITTEEASKNPDRFILHFNVQDSVEIYNTDGYLSVGYTEGIQWYLNGEPIDGATMPELELFESGIYEVTVDNGDCQLKGTREVLITSIGNLSEEGLKIYPNPVTDEMTVSTTGPALIQSVTIMDVFGKIVGSVRPGDAAKSLSMSLNELADGTYYAIVEKGNTLYYVKIIKQ